MTRILIIALGGVGAALAFTLTVWVPNLYESRASAKAALSTALTANASLMAARDRARAEADAERDRAIQRQHERDAMAGQLVELRRVLGDGAAGCAWTPEKAKAVDEFLGGDVK